jgi:transcriptional regulator with XRE-family HTH domain
LSVDDYRLRGKVLHMHPPREHFARNLRRHRRRLGLSQEKLAEICDLHRTEISLLERRKRSPRLETIVTLAAGLKLSSVCELLDGIVVPEQTPARRARVS